MSLLYSLSAEYAAPLSLPNEELDTGWVPDQARSGSEAGRIGFGRHGSVAGACSIFLQVISRLQMADLLPAGWQQKCLGNACRTFAGEETRGTRAVARIARKDGVK